MKKKNTFFMVSAIISVVSAVSAFICSIMFAFLNTVADTMGPEYFETAEEYAVFLKIKPMFSIFAGLMVITLAGAIFTSIVYFKKMKQSSEDIVKSKGLIIASIVIAFVTSSAIIGIFGIIGLNKAQKEAAVVANADSIESAKINIYDDAGLKLERLNELKAKGLISEEDYAAQKSKILEK